HAALAQWRRQNLSEATPSRADRVEGAELRDHYSQLSRLDPLPLYAEFLAAELLREIGQAALAAELLGRFVEQAAQASIGIAVGLRAEVTIARAWLSESTDSGAS